MYRSTKYLILGIMFIVFSFGLAWLAHAQENTYDLPYGKIQVTFEPSPDTRVIGHILYFKENREGGEEYNVRLAGGVDTYIFEEGDLAPNSSWVLTATAFDVNQVQSERCAPAYLNIGSPKIPDEKFPEKQKKPTPPGLIKKILGFF